MPNDRALDSLLNSAPATRALAAHYDKAIRRIVAELTAGVSRAQAFRAEALLARLRKLLEDLDPKKSKFLNQWIKENVRKAYVIGDDGATAALRSELRAAPGKARSMPPIDAQFTAINEVAINGLVVAMNSTMGKMKTQVEKVLGTVVRQTQTSLARATAIRDATTQGFIRGSTAQQISDDIASILLGKHLPIELKERLRSVGFDGSMFNTFEAAARGKMITVGKRTFSVRQYSDLVANTQLREAHKVATLSRLRRNGVRHVRISIHTQTVPDVCTPFAGRVFFTGEGGDPAGFPSLRSTPNGGPPWHPYCKHSLRPFVVALRDASQIELERKNSEEIVDFLGSNSTAIGQKVKSLPAAQFKRIAGQGESQS